MPSEKYLSHNHECNMLFGNRKKTKHHTRHFKICFRKSNARKKLTAIYAGMPKMHISRPDQDEVNMS